MKLTCLLSCLTLYFIIGAQAQTRSVMVDTNNNLVFPTNFFNVNSNLLNQASSSPFGSNNEVQFRGDDGTFLGTSVFQYNVSFDFVIVPTIEFGSVSFDTNPKIGIGPNTGGGNDLLTIYREHEELGLLEGILELGTIYLSPNFRGVSGAAYAGTEDGGFSILGREASTLDTSGFALITKAKYNLSTNAPSFGTWITNGLQRLHVQANFQLSSTSSDSAIIELIIEQGEGITNRWKQQVGASPSGITDFRFVHGHIQPNARYMFNNLSTGSATAAFVTEGYLELFK